MEGIQSKIEEYFASTKDLYELLLDFFENEDETPKDELITKIKEIKEQGNNEDKITIFQIILSISSNHRRIYNYKIKIDIIFQYLADILKQTFTNCEIFEFFKSNKFILHYLIKNQIIEIDETIFKTIKKEKSFLYFFYPEISKYLNEEEKDETRKEMLLKYPNIFDKFEKKREEGENENYIYTLIRNDAVSEFISYVNQKSIPLSNKIKPSIFETNPFLIDKTPTLLEYSAFFGSIQIIKYFINNKFKIKGSIWEYAIHSNNAEIIDILLNEHIEIEDNTYLKCFHESIKCHHNDIANYIQDNLLTGHNEQYFEISIQYRNYLFFPDISKLSLYIHNFYNFYKYDYSTITKYLIEEKSKTYKEYNSKFINIFKDFKFNRTIRQATNEDDTIGIYCLLLKRNEINDIYFQNNDHFTKIIIPPTIKYIKDYGFDGCSLLSQILLDSPCSITLIGDYVFRNCSSLTQITIPSTVTSIGSYAFENCSSLILITIPSSVFEIGDYAFSGCSSLTQITFETPSSVTKIGNHIFDGCSSLIQITIPSSVTSIGNNAFRICSSLSQITFEIPSSLASIGSFAFLSCSSLTQISIPPSVKSIGNTVFHGCSSLKLIAIPSSVTSIGNYVFYRCSSLTQITIPSSVTSIGNNTFDVCSSLTQITILSSVTSIEDATFYMCSSLKQITIPSSVTSIGNYAFSECSSLTQIVIPSSVTSIGNFAFSGCSSLTQITIPSSVTSFGHSSFSGCPSLIQITIPTSCNIYTIGIYSAVKIIYET